MPTQKSITPVNPTKQSKNCPQGHTTLLSILPSFLSPRLSADITSPVLGSLRLGHRCYQRVDSRILADLYKSCLVLTLKTPQRTFSDVTSHHPSPPSLPCPSHTQVFGILCPFLFKLCLALEAFHSILKPTFLRNIFRNHAILLPPHFFILIHTLFIFSLSFRLSTLVFLVWLTVGSCVIFCTARLHT